MGADRTRAAASVDGGRAPVRRLPPRAPVTVHRVSLVCSLAYWVVLDRNLWFYGDEWDFLVRRGLHHPAVGIWAPHNEHWSTLPILLWRGLFSAVHLSSYWPYLLPLLAAHLALVHLVWRRALRSGAHPWVATAVAALVGLYGPGWEDLAWAFQIGFVGALLLGFLAVEVIDGGPPSWSRDVLASALVTASLMCSGVGDAMALGVAVAILSRRHWVRASRVLAVPAVAEALWWVRYGRQGMATMGDHIGPAAVAGLPAFVWAQLANTLGSGLVPLGMVVAAVLAAWALWRLPSLWRGQPGALGLAAAALTFYALAGLARDRLHQGPPSRYTYIGVVLLAPLVAVALSNLAACYRRARPRLAPALVAALVGGFMAADLPVGAQAVAARTAFIAREHRQIVTTARLAAAGGRRWLNRYPFPNSGLFSGYLTVGDAVSLLKQGALPAGPAPVGAQRAYDLTWLDVGFTAPLAGTGSLAAEASTPKLTAAAPGCVALSARHGYGVMRLAPAGALSSPSSGYSLQIIAAPHTEVVVALVPPSGRGIPARLPAVDGERLTVPAGGRGLLRDVAARYDLLISVPTQRTEVCGLASAPVLSRHQRAPVDAARTGTRQA